MSNAKTKHQLRLELETAQALLARYQARETTAVASPSIVLQTLQAHEDLSSLEQEHFWAILMNARQKILKILLIAKGSVAEVTVHPRDVFREAIRMNVSSMIIAHNHPSGDVQPSEGDDDLTYRLVDAGQLLGIPVLDHLVVSETEFYSYAEHGRLA